MPDSTANALATGARNRGVSIIENTRVTDVLTSDGKVSGVSTSRGDIECEVLVVCAGMWSREIGLMCGVPIPLHAADHAYFVTEQVPGAADDMPSLRDPDGYIYVRRYPYEGGGLLIGGFEPEAEPWGNGRHSGRLLSPHAQPGLESLQHIHRRSNKTDSVHSGSGSAV